METINQELDQMLTKNIESDADKVNKINSSNLMILRDLFRQAIANRNRSSASLMMRENELCYLKDLIKEVISVFNQFGANDRKLPLNNLSLESFIKESNQKQKNMRSELWKLEMLCNQIVSLASEQETLLNSSMNASA